MNKVRLPLVEEMGRAIRFRVPAVRLGEERLQSLAERVVLAYFKERGLVPGSAWRLPWKVQLGVAGWENYTVTAAWNEPSARVEARAEPELVRALFECLVVLEKAGASQAERCEQARRVRRVLDGVVGRAVAVEGERYGGI